MFLSKGLDVEHWVRQEEERIADICRLNSENQQTVTKTQRMDVRRMSDADKKHAAGSLRQALQNNPVLAAAFAQPDF
jgi:hypothetical protein